MKLIARVRSARKKWESVDQKILMQEEIISNINRSITNGDWVMETTHKEKQGLGSFISWVPPTFKETLANSLETCPKLQEGTFHNSLWCSMKENTLNNVSNKFVNLQKKYYQMSPYCFCIIVSKATEMRTEKLIFARSCSGFQSIVPAMAVHITVEQNSRSEPAAKL